MRFYVVAITAKKSLRLFFFNLFTKNEILPIAICSDNQDIAVDLAWNACLDAYPTQAGYYSHDVILHEIPGSFLYSFLYQPKLKKYS